jgi:nucleoside-diphosphate-sugar epimerase
MRLLVTGAGGFLGRNVLLAVPTSWDVIALYRSGTDELPRFLDRHPLAHVRPIPCDLTRAEEVRHAATLAGDAFDQCLYLASNTSIPDSIDHPIHDLTANTISLLNTLETWTFDHFVYLSSGAVYIGLRGQVGPDSFVAPTLPYAISKWASEHYVRAFTQHRGSPARATVVRFFGAFGPYEPARKIYTKMVRRFAIERRADITITGDGENYIDAMYVDDAVAALLAILARPPEYGARTVDLGMGNGDTVNDLVRRAGHVFGLEPVITHNGGLPEYIEFTIDPGRFGALYDWRPRTTLEDGLRRFAEHLRNEDASGGT